jgi:antitoxin ParD1/3/4
MSRGFSGRLGPTLLPAFQGRRLCTARSRSECFSDGRNGRSEDAGHQRRTSPCSGMASVADNLPIFAKGAISQSMTTMNISLPDALKVFVDQQVNARGYGTSSEYVRELIRKDQDIQRLREMLLDGASSVATAPVDAGYFQGLRDRVTQLTAS